LFFFSSIRRHTKSKRDWSSDVCSSDLCESILRGGTFLGSSKIQLANSLLISPTWPSFGLIKTARSSEPSPLKSPTRNAGLRENRSEERRVGLIWRVLRDWWNSWVA